MGIEPASHPVSQNTPPKRQPASGQRRAGSERTSVRRAADRQAQRSGSVLASLARALQHRSYRVACQAVANEAARRLSCQRVSIGMGPGEHLALAACSDSGGIDKRQNAVARLLAAMMEARDQRCVIVHPMPHNGTNLIAVGHAELARMADSHAICSIPVVVNRKVLGVITLERDHGFDARSIEIARDIAAFVGPVLDMKRRLEQTLPRRLLEALRPRGAETAAPGFRPKVWIAAGVFTVLALASLWPTTWQVVAPARIESVGQHIMAAPVDGFIRQAHVRPGDNVVQGQLLLTLDDQDLQAEHAKWQAEVQNLDKEYRDALSAQSAADVVIARSRLEQADVQLQLVQRQLARTQIRAPIDGLVLNGDLQQAAGMPVKRGQELMALAPGDSWRVVIESSEQQVSDVHSGQSAHLVLQAAPDVVTPLSVDRVSPVAVQLGNDSVFEVAGALTEHAATDHLRHGMRGVARVDISSRSLGWIAWHKLATQTRRVLWKLLG